MHESFGCLDVVVCFGDTETVDAEGVAVCCGWAKLALVVAFFPGFLADDVFTVGAPLSGSVEEVPDNPKFEFVFLCEHRGEFEFGFGRPF